jgi:hypothetical protein
MSVTAVPRVDNRMTPEQRTERARIGGRARFARMTPEQRTVFQRRAGMASRVNNIVRRISELTPDQRQRLLAALCDSHEPDSPA